MTQAWTDYEHVMAAGHGDPNQMDAPLAEKGDESSLRKLVAAVGLEPTTYGL